MATSKRTLVDDPRWGEFVKRYAFDLPRFAIEVCRIIPTHQQWEMFESVQDPGSRTSVSSGHGTGKTAGYGIIALWHLLCYKNSNTILSAPKLTTVSDGVWKEFADLKGKIKNGPHAWIDDYYEVAAQRVYVKGFKLNWWVVAKTAPRGSPENLAGAHRDWLLFLVDEASGVPDDNFGVITGALTDKRNRMCIASQPTRASGFFYDTHHTLSLAEGGAWNNLVFSSADSPIVSVEFIAEKKKQYTKEEFSIKVLGEFAEMSSKYLLSAREVQACVGLVAVRPDEPYGWLLPVDVGGGGYRDKSVVLALRVMGEGEYGDGARRAQLVKVPVCSNDQDVSDLPGVIIKEAGERNGSVALVDAGGIGLGVCKQLEKADFHNFKKINWGVPNFRKEYKDRYTNQRAQAMCGIARAVQEGRFGIDADIDPAFVKQLVREASRIPYHYDEKARRYIAKKEDMKKDGIPSPDVWDSCSFTFLEDAYYNQAGDAANDDGGDAKAKARARLMATMGLNPDGSPMDKAA
jgi:hypothetical protein